ncbi:hypothetical protein QR680_017396 [Steinernema hermaphroditum]|uniref:V-type proton ATPase subunit H n=1 Tax=Steinernema hermaphroditum TaxID=289476 RepID=A0AA39LP25_9BILA|nr:hypothetical protein QR680_017396 [Steinernema hermaphroditum]
MGMIEEAPMEAEVPAHAIAPVDMINATSKLQLEAAEVRSNKPNWMSYQKSQLIQQEDYNFIVAYENARSKAERDDVIARDPAQTARSIISLVTTVAKDQNIRYVLTLFDDLLQEDKSRVDIFHSYAAKQKTTIWSGFLAILQRQDSFIINQMSSIFAKLACYGTTLMHGEDLKYYFAFLKDELKSPSNEYMNTSARCLQMMLRIEEYRSAFVEQDGIASLVNTLEGKTNFQLQYQLIFALWCITFNGANAAKLVNGRVIHVLGDILSECSKEKVVRIILTTFRNILEKSDDRELVRVAALQMVQCKTLKALELMDAKKFDDPDMQDDSEYLSEQLHLSVQDLSSFDEYVTELQSGRLHWSPVHKSDKFWKENAHRFNENRFELVKKLIQFLETDNSDKLVLCVAAHDIGEYVRHYPRGKTVIEQFQGKQAVMRLLSDEDPNVRYHALLAVQKLMVHNWEYLGKQLGDEPEAVAAK